MSLEIFLSVFADGKSSQAGGGLLHRVHVRTSWLLFTIDVSI
jgi:hypothetical protein